MAKDSTGPFTSQGSSQFSNRDTSVAWNEYFLSVFTQEDILPLLEPKLVFTKKQISLVHRITARKW